MSCSNARMHAYMCVRTSLCVCMHVRSCRKLVSRIWMMWLICEKAVDTWQGGGTYICQQNKYVCISLQHNHRHVVSGVTKRQCTTVNKWHARVLYTIYHKTIKLNNITGTCINIGEWCTIYKRNKEIQSVPRRFVRIINNINLLIQPLVCVCVCVFTEDMHGGNFWHLLWIR